MSLVRGKAVLIKVENEDGTFIPVMGQTGGSLSRNVDTIDITTKDSEFSEVEISYHHWSVSCEGLYKLQDNAYELVEDAFMNKTKVKVEIAFPDFVYTGEGYILNIDNDLAQDGCISYSMEINGSGVLEKVAS